MRTVYSVLTSVKNRVTSAWCALRDFRTNQHIVVFESDDWGSIRMSNRKDWGDLLNMGYAVDKRPYERFDTLESPNDLEALFEVLSKFKDANGNHPVLTANMLMVNPDFEKIKEERYQAYYYEPIADTYTRYYGDTRVLALMKQGMDSGVFMPQSHGREHFNVRQWLAGLQAGNEDLLTAYRFGMCGIAPKAHPEIGNQMMSALLASNEYEQKEIDRIVAEGLTLFEKMWGFKSKTFVAPRYLWNESSEKTLSENGVELFQTDRRSKPAFHSPVRFFSTGSRNKYGQVYSVRNCRFEPATKEGGESVDDLMEQIDNTFKQHKLVVFSTHRINYAGGIDESNRTRTLRVLDEFLTRLLIKYPDTVFMSSNQLIEVLK